jgi:hypothetical protein
LTVQADAGVALLAHAAATAGDVERHRDEVAGLDELDPGTDFDHLTGDLVPEDQARRRGGAAADHVLVRPADVGRHDLQDRAVRGLAPDIRRVDAWAVLQLQLRVVDCLHLDLPRLYVRNCLVTGHGAVSFRL